MKKFRDWLYKQELTIQQFCDLAKISRASLDRWRKGKFRPRIESMVRIREATKGKFSKPEDLRD